MCGIIYSIYLLQCHSIYFTLFLRFYYCCCVNFHFFVILSVFCHLYYLLHYLLFNLYVSLVF